MAEVARISSHLVNNATDVVLHMERRFQVAVDAPANLTFLREVGPILKFHLCINRSYQQLMDLHWRNHTTPVWNVRTEFPAAQAWPYLNHLFSSVAVTLIPPEFLSDAVSRIFSYAVQSSANPRAAVIHIKAELTVVHPRRPSVQFVDSVVIVDEPPVHPIPAGGDWVGRAVDSVMIVDAEPEATPVYHPRRPERRWARDLKERYLFRASEADDNLGDCAVCLEELKKIITGRKSSSRGDDVLKMPCSHKFHYRCISKWLKRSDSCPLCRAVIP